MKFAYGELRIERGPKARGSGIFVGRVGNNSFTIYINCSIIYDGRIVTMNKILVVNDGLRIAYAYNPNVRSVCWGVFVGVGSMDESEKNSGISHLIEHMCFKGTKTRSAYDIVRESENLGANINAFTSKEQTAFYVQCVDDSVEKCVEILADIVQNMTFDQEELEKEKQVVIEEIAMSEDAPDDLAGDLAAEAFWGENSLSRPILGTKENVEGFTREDLFAHVKRYYTKENIVLSVVGNVEEREVVRLAETYFHFAAGAVEKTDAVYPRKAVQRFRKKDVEQCNVVLVYDGLKRYDEDTYALNVFDAVLGGGMSSILFQKVREELGLAYSVYSYPASYRTMGAYCIYIGTTPAKADIALRTIAKIVEDLKAKGIDREQMERGRTQTLSNYVFGMENGMSVMRVQARRLMYKGEAFDVDEEINKIKEVDLDKINALIKRVFAAAPAVGVVAPEYVDCKGVFDGNQ